MCSCLLMTNLLKISSTTHLSPLDTFSELAESIQYPFETFTELLEKHTCIHIIYSMKFWFTVHLLILDDFNSVSNIFYYWELLGLIAYTQNIHIALYNFQSYRNFLFILCLALVKYLLANLHKIISRVFGLITVSIKVESCTPILL